MYVGMYVYIYMCVCVYIYIYIYYSRTVRVAPPPCEITWARMMVLTMTAGDFVSQNGNIHMLQAGAIQQGGASK